MDRHLPAGRQDLSQARARPLPGPDPGGMRPSHENKRLQSQGKPLLVEPGDIDAAMQTASAIGDDTLQRKATGRVVPDSFTHGSSAQRQRWFMNGYREGTVAGCNTFRSENL